MTIRSFLLLLLVTVLMSSSTASIALSTSPSGNWEVVKTDVTPSRRHDKNVDYDPINDKVLMFGGSDGIDNNETWLFDPQSLQWTQIDAAMAPSRRSVHEVVWVPTLEKFILFGGSHNTQFLTDMWTFDASTNTWEEIVATGTPGTSWYHRMSYVPEHDIILNFGGWGAGFEWNNEIWQFHISNYTWTEIETTTAPPPRVEGNFVYDPASQKAIVYGGESRDQQQMDDTWIFDYSTSTWQELNPVTTPFVAGDLQWSADMGYSYDQVANLTYFTRDFQLWYLNLTANTWENISTNPPSLSFEVNEWSPANSFEYISSIDSFIQFGGYDFNSPNSNNYKKQTLLLSMHRPNITNSAPLSDPSDTSDSVSFLLPVSLISTFTMAILQARRRSINLE